MTTNGPSEIAQQTIIRLEGAVRLDKAAKRS
ncbi:MAG: hypothetical protein QOJ71_1940, partial [Actinomycetota bacterium]|nr:hypothetical protein [Actinomycetota bacterium]